jgi:hypothetical protein
MSITCPQCLMTSHHPMDELHRYCGNCHQFHADMDPRRPIIGCRNGILLGALSWIVIIALVVIVVW